MNEVYVVIFNRLESVLTVPVGDHIPQDGGYPYVQVNPLNLTNDDTVEDRGFSATIDVIAWSRYKGSQQIAEMMGDIYTALHRYDLDDSANYCIVGIHQEFSKIITESDGLTRQGIQRFKLFFEEI
ncbi:MAG: DUF3168 domain-containing protein [Gammaproteobacteria bacterium]|nr:DUF3168 domain-containing protein [Gammaproteobacteria bacterium]